MHNVSLYYVVRQQRFSLLPGELIGLPFTRLFSHQHTPIHLGLTQPWLNESNISFLSYTHTHTHSPVKPRQDCDSLAACMFEIVPYSSFLHVVDACWIPSFPFHKISRCVQRDKFLQKLVESSLVLE